MGGTSAAGTAYPSGNLRVHPRILVVFMLLKERKDLSTKKTHKEETNQ
jgi:hypothetical protein